MTTPPTETVRELALSNPCAAAILEDLHIDYCCGGDRSLVEACAQAGVSVQSVRSRIASAARAPGDVEWQGAPLGDLIDHILVVHHEHDRRELVRLRALAAKVLGAHGARHPELARVCTLLGQIATDLEPHMLKEERILFPHIRALDGGGAVPRPPFGTLGNPVAMMTVEHEAIGGILLELRAVTSDFVAPDDGCASYRAFCAGLLAFERELHQHIHLENNILFPAALLLDDTTHRAEALPS